MGKGRAMGKTIIYRLLHFLLTLLLVSIFLFSVFYFLKGDSSSVILGEEVSEEAKDNYIGSMEIKKGFIPGYLSSMRRFFTLDWGNTLSGESIRSVVASSFPVSLSLSVWSFILSFPFSLFLSIRAVRERGFSALLSALLSVLFLLLPSFLSSIILILVFSSTLHMFPVAGYISPSEGLWVHLRSIILPSLALSLLSTSFMLRIFRETLEANMRKPFVNYARAKGVREKRLVVREALKPSLPVIISTTAQSVVSFFASSTVVETVFALPGMGRALVSSAASRDYPLSFVLVMLDVTVICLVLFVSKILISCIDRRGERENGKA